MRKVSLVMVALLCLVMLAGAWQVFSFLLHTSGASSEKLVLDVPPGRSFYSVSLELEEKKLITNARFFRILGKLTGQDRGLHVGEYEISRGMNPMNLLGVIVSGHSIPHPFTIPEGTNMYDVATLLEAKGFGSAEGYLKLFKDPQLIKGLLGEEVYSLEGYLFPETYYFHKYMKPPEIVKTMVNMFLKVYAKVAQGKSTSLTRHEVVTLASVIEKETGAKQERPLISSVFHNRLKIGMRLQSDPTTLYGILDQTGVMKKNITRKDLLGSTKYNTYVVPKLPFGPIANPGREALKAVFTPETSRYLYFVSQNDGTHIFSETYEAHERAVRRFQMDPRARKGKSWRDLKQ
ncbi:MAG: endolytic transglycosylase MltG [Bdellovibrionales bacterium]|nr:endolytic transglycosylase MltG [Bdellovibrionales bacterium]